MILRDSVLIRSTTPSSARRDMLVPAMVYTLTGENPAKSNRPDLLVTELRAIVGPTPREIDPVEDTVTHHGTTYKIDGRPMGRYRNGRLHHWTIQLKRVEG